MWVEHPVPTQVDFALYRVMELASQHPEWKNDEPFKSIIAGNRAAMSKFTIEDLEAVVIATHAGMMTEEFHEMASTWIAPGTTPSLEPRLYRTGSPYTS
jgi:hypothetical protein